MSDRDDELDRMLEPLASVEPSRQQMRRWQNLAPRRPTSARRPLVLALQLTAAACVGFVVGAWYFGKSSNDEMVAKNFDSSATIEMTYVNSR